MQVAGVLKEDGTLGKIQAELRAAVYFAMEAANSGISNAATEPSPLGEKYYNKHLFSATSLVHTLLQLLCTFMSKDMG